jgi:hypothetical protein
MFGAETQLHNYNQQQILNMKKLLGIVTGGIVMVLSVNTQAVQIVNDGVWSLGSDYVAAIGFKNAPSGTSLTSANLQSMVTSGSAFSGGTLYYAGPGLVGYAGWVSGLADGTLWEQTFTGANPTVDIVASDIDRPSDNRVFAALLYVWDGSQFTTAGTSTFNAGQSQGEFPLSTPDGGSTLVLMGIALAGLGSLRRKLFC